MGQRCLVFGGTGFLGMNLCYRLYREGYMITVYGRNNAAFERLKQRCPSIRFIYGNYQEEHEFDLLLKDIDIVFHLISTTTPQNTNLFYDIESNVLPTIHLLESCRNCKVKQIIYFSSGGTVYGIPKNIPIAETADLNPISSYGVHKVTVEKCISYYGQYYGIDYKIIRISNPYGPGQNPFSGQGVIAAFLAKALMKECIEIWGDGTIIRDYIYIDDVIDAIILLMHYNGEYNTFNIGYGEGHSLNELIKEIEGVLELKLKVIYSEGRKQDVKLNILDTNLISNQLKWKPIIELKSGISKMKNFWNQEEKCFAFFESE